MAEKKAETSAPPKPSSLLDPGTGIRTIAPSSHFFHPLLTEGVELNQRVYALAKSDPVWFEEHHGMFVAIIAGVFLGGKFKTYADALERVHAIFEDANRAVAFYIVCVGDEPRDNVGTGPAPRP